MRARRVIWIVLLALAGVQAWTARHTTTPDGMSYLDLSDSVVGGHPGGLLNAYWSPLYPVLIGVLRLVLRPTPYWEFTVQHLLNLFLFVGSLAGFEYFRSALQDAAASWNHKELSTTAGIVVAYLIFGLFSLMMTPLSLPTPDLLVSTASYIAFGALLRLTHGSSWRRAAVVLGVALALGSLAKSFVILWSVICLLTAWLVTRGRWSWRPAAASIAIWMIVVVPWCLALSVSMGRVTFGDSGRLTYIWYVNEVESPSDKRMPHAAATPATDSILTGVAITPNAPGTNPIWYDPARWYSGLKPKFEAGKQLRVFSFLVGMFVASLAPVVLFLWFSLAVAPRPALRAWWGRTWVVILPSLLAIGAYSLILVTTRYVAPFYVTMVLAVWIGLDWPSRIVPLRLVVAVGLPMLVMIVTPRTSDVVSIETAVLAGVLFAWAGRRWKAFGMIACGILGALFVKLLIPAEQTSYVVGAAVLVTSGYWLAGSRAIATREGHRLSKVLRLGLVTTSALIITWVGVAKYLAGLDHPATIDGEPNPSWVAVQNLRRAGVVAGARIAFVGSPFETYWARTGGYRLVAVVPPPRIEEYLGLAPARREALIREFMRAGATRLIVQTNASPDVADRRWKPVELVGWVRELPAR